MKRSATTVEPSAEHTAQTIVETLRRHGYIAYFAGGCVRDRLLGVDAKDFDIATDARTDAVQALFPRTIPVGMQFGVCLVIVDKCSFEVATFRTDGGYHDGRHPSTVRFGSPQEDARRRDFTINGMFYDPLTGRVIDYVGGRADLVNGTVRAIGNPVHRFHEDRLRMLRAVRFAARLDFTIAPSTQTAIRELASSLTTIAWERVGDEVVKLLVEGAARRGFALLADTRLLDQILPELDRSEASVIRTLLILKQLDTLVRPSEALALGAVLLDAAESPTSCVANSPSIAGGDTEGTTGARAAELAVDVCRRLKRSRATWERVAFLVTNHARLLAARRLPMASLKRLLRQDGIHELLELTRLRALASGQEPAAYTFCRQKLDTLGLRELYPPRLLSGHDLLELGFAPGPRLATILRELEDAQLEGRLNSRESVLAWVKRHWQPDRSSRPD